MDVYFDSGAPVKLYVKEHYSEEVTTLASAEELSHKHTKYILCRALDILHVSSALCFSCSRFVTGDKRQAKLANETKLDVHLLGDEC